MNLKRSLNFILIISVLLLIVLIFGFIYINVFTDNWEIRKPWVTSSSYILISLFFLVFFVAFTIKILSSKKELWIKIILLVIYSIILTPSIFLLFKNRLDTRFIILGLISLTTIILLVLLKGLKWKKVFLSIHTILFSLISLGFLIILAFNKDKERDIVREDKLILFQLEDGRQKVIIQGEGVWEKEYFISFDLGFIRKRVKFEGILKDGRWKVYNKSGEIVSIVTIRDGVETKKERVLFENKILVSSINDIKNNLNRPGLTFMIEGKKEFDESILLTNCRDITFESIPGKTEAEISFENSSNLSISNSSNITFNDINFVSANAESLIKIDNSFNINIINSILNGNDSTKTGVEIDKNSSNIQLNNNDFNNFSNYPIIGYSFNTKLFNNRFNSKNNNLTLRSILLKDKHYDRNSAFKLIENILLNYEGENRENDTKYVIIFNKSFYNFQGTFTELLYEYSVSSELEAFFKSDYSQNIKCSWNYCANLIEILLDDQVFIPTPISNDSWCFNDKNEPKFSFVNPNIFKWFSEDLNLQPNYTIQGVSYLYIYENLFKNITRDYFIIHKTLLNNDKHSDLINRYKFFVDSAKSNYELDLFLLHEFSKINPLSIEYKFYKETSIEEDRNNSGNFYQNSKINLYDSQIVIDQNRHIIAKDYLSILSFWIRREIDGSASEIDKALEYYIKRFDNDWLNEIIE